MLSLTSAIAASGSTRYETALHGIHGPRPIQLQLRVKELEDQVKLLQNELNLVQSERTQNNLSVTQLNQQQQHCVSLQTDMAALRETSNQHGEQLATMSCDVTSK